MKVSLKSDFMDYYDHWFDREGEAVFERMSAGGMPRKEMFYFLEQRNLNVPIFGTVKNVHSKLSNPWKKRGNFSEFPPFPKMIERFDSVVVYLDEQAHRGEGKVLMTVDEAMEKYPNAFCSQFIPNGSTLKGSWSLRYLQVGNKRWWLMYQNPDGWRSNYGENVSVSVIGEDKPVPLPDPHSGYLRNVKYPLFAVDFVMGAIGMYALDFNIAPGLKGTGIEEILKAEEVVGLIKKFYEEFSGKK